MEDSRKRRAALEGDPQKKKRHGKEKKLKNDKAEETETRQNGETSPGDADPQKKKRDGKEKNRNKAEVTETCRNGDERASVSPGDAGRAYTVSLALPGSILENAQSAELRSYLAGQVARALTIFAVDEVVVFDEQGADRKSAEDESPGAGKHGYGSVQLARILQYLECPQYLRKAFFPKHKDLQYAGLLNPVDSPHHMRRDEESPYREGVVLEHRGAPGASASANCGLYKEVTIDRKLQPGTRVTVQMEGNSAGRVVAPHVPRTRAGIYWGYTVRLASGLGDVFTECPFKGGYDLTIGTSERGASVDDVSLPPFRHLLLVFGGLQGLESSLASDRRLRVAEPSLLFHLYLNTCPGQASRTIRTEEAILISLAMLRPKITARDTRTGSGGCTDAR
ncbi:putative methyltransferase C9orf114 homolog [Lethenteron reissneri]|uniref:putative methyltransferase C9orf114 homolog n=1 Tax=Lethenteron reissneri TaxID=7753 RepID=UPI002AB6D0C0|nr:putative methyltransferase C9orf114 homolog [Lethenteron reissneri]XP_061434751.1 putative methyltransferase C9orf114 homolog [Lethenteron reissneri]XP_061434752.1 putative methyltransferase C9orf114 homolog [Lethenteron reissneri]